MTPITTIETGNDRTSLANHGNDTYLEPTKEDTSAEFTQQDSVYEEIPDCTRYIQIGEAGNKVVYVTNIFDISEEHSNNQNFIFDDVNKTDKTVFILFIRIYTLYIHYIYT